MAVSIYKIEHIGRGSFALMARPGSGSSVAADIVDIAAQGYNRVASMLADDEAQMLGLAKEKQQVEQASMAFDQFAIVDMQLPQSLQAFAEFSRDLYQRASSGENVVVHCRAGIGRSGITAAAVLLHHGMLAEDAFAQISHKRGLAVPDTQEQYDWIVSNQAEIIALAGLA
jgi:protein-tyrosine phosphatase